MSKKYPMVRVTAETYEILTQLKAKTGQCFTKLLHRAIRLERARMLQTEHVSRQALLDHYLEGDKA